MPSTKKGGGPGSPSDGTAVPAKNMAFWNIGELRIKDIMTRDPVCVEIPGSRSNALNLMAKHTFSGLPVVKKRTRTLVGGITRHDIFEKPEEDQLAIVMETDIQTIGPDDSLRVLAKKIIDTGCYRVVVVGEDDEVAGIVTPADLLFLLESPDFDKPLERYNNNHTCVPVFRRTPLPVVAHIMRISHYYALPVLDEDLHVVGMATDIDLFSHAEVDERIVRSDLGIGLDDDEWSWEGIRNILSVYNSVSKTSLPLIPVETVMVKDVISAYRQTTVSTAAHKMRKHDIAQLPILDSDDKLAGMVRNADIIKALLD